MRKNTGSGNDSRIDVDYWEFMTPQEKKLEKGKGNPFSGAGPIVAVLLIIFFILNELASCS